MEEGGSDSSIEDIILSLKKHYLEFPIRSECESSSAKHVAKNRQENIDKLKEQMWNCELCSV